MLLRKKTLALHENFSVLLWRPFPYRAVTNIVTLAYRPYCVPSLGPGTTTQSRMQAISQKLSIPSVAVLEFAHHWIGAW